MKAAIIPENMLRWRLRVLMAEKNISNKELSERSGLHPVHISKLKNVDELKQVAGVTLNRLCDGLNLAYRSRGDETLITPGDLFDYSFDIPEDKDNV